MNGYERVMTAMALEQPDRVPIAEFVIDPQVYRALVPTAREQSDFEEAYALDAVSCQNQYVRLAEVGDTFTDEWGVTYKDNKQKVLIPLKGPITSVYDLKTYHPPDPDRPERLGRLPELVRKYKGQKAIIFHQREAFLWATYLVGMDNLLIAFLDEPAFAMELLHLILDVNLRLARNAIRAGADIITVSDDYAFNDGPLFSPQIFERFIRPCLQKMVDTIHEEGALVIKHSDGNLMKILDPIVDTGIDALNPIDPLAGMDIHEVKQQYGHKVCLWGNIDCSNLLSFGTVDEVEQAVKTCIRNAASGGGFVLSSSNSIHSSVKPENYAAMLRAGNAYGIYPLAL